RMAALSDDELATLLADREVRPDVAWNDFFDAAEAMLEPAAIARLLPRLRRDDAIALSAAVGGIVTSSSPASDEVMARERLQALLLLQPDGTPYPSVAQSVAGRPALSAVDDTAR